MRNKLKWLIEDTIAKVAQQINVRIDIERSKHAGERQFRDTIHPISDIEIIEIVKLAIPEIADDLMFDKLSMGSQVLIRHIGTDINIVGALHPGQNDEIDFVVITVMRKRNFMPKYGTKVIEV